MATEQLFAQDKVDALEFNFDQPLNGVVVAPWCQDLLNKFSSASALIGHGVNLSLLSAQFTKRQQEWLEYTREEFNSRRYVHASEHFGFSEAGPIAQAAPLAVPMDAQSLHLGKEMLKRYADATQCPVGLENLAFAFSLEDVKRQGEFIDQLISSVDGFLLLDLHNIYCQVANFDLDALELLHSYPLSKVKEMHLSGGSWSPSLSGKRIAVRRDTHDDAVPQEVFNLTALALKLCPNTQFVILERLGNTMLEPELQEEYRDDFDTIREILDYSYD
ncbi:MAG: DUF692 family protein [Candidatus Obscuribacter sp.]|nr:DUF692 family protein [Candidatus Obscuribacter sp.]MBP6348846.1 DUF692 family protein [Candidatus Obscuribacter sp.]MBP6592556.1 DUF692 family protein [Candidatus Obscuribacter sp.]MBP7576029.1 DUF692 family protein [Candidatus Obscuribacter sp.]